MTFTKNVKAVLRTMIEIFATRKSRTTSILGMCKYRSPKQRLNLPSGCSILGMAKFNQNSGAAYEGKKSSVRRWKQGE